MTDMPDFKTTTGRIYFGKNSLRCIALYASGINTKCDEHFFNIGLAGYWEKFSISNCSVDMT